MRYIPDARLLSKCLITSLGGYPSPFRACIVQHMGHSLLMDRRLRILTNSYTSEQGTAGLSLRLETA
jgi:hypothetical protein